MTLEELKAVVDKYFSQSVGKPKHHIIDDLTDLREHIGVLLESLSDSDELED